MSKELKQFDWSKHIEYLNDFPDIKMTWEKQFVLTVLNIISKDKIKKALEVGCSNGRWLRWFKKEYNCQIYGLDNNAGGFVGQDINFQVGDGRNMPFGDKSFDLVFSLGLVEHFIREEKIKLLKEQVRVLNNGGYLVCSMPLLSPFYLNFFYVKLNYDLRKGYKHFITTQKELEKYFKEIGLKIIFSKKYGNLMESLLGSGKADIFLKNKILSKIFASEILIIGKKI